MQTLNSIFCQARETKRLLRGSPGVPDLSGKVDIDTDLEAGRRREEGGVSPQGPTCPSGSGVQTACTCGTGIDAEGDSTANVVRPCTHTPPVQVSWPATYFPSATVPPATTPLADRRRSSLMKRWAASRARRVSTYSLNDAFLTIALRVAVYPIMSIVLNALYIGKWSSPTCAVIY